MPGGVFGMRAEDLGDQPFGGPHTVFLVPVGDVHRGQVLQERAVDEAVDLVAVQAQDEVPLAELLDQRPGCRGRLDASQLKTLLQVRAEDLLEVVAVDVVARDVVRAVLHPARDELQQFQAVAHVECGLGLGGGLVREELDVLVPVRDQDGDGVRVDNLPVAGEGLTTADDREHRQQQGIAGQFTYRVRMRDRTGQATLQLLT